MFFQATVPPLAVLLSGWRVAKWMFALVTLDMLLFLLGQTYGVFPEPGASIGTPIHISVVYTLLLLVLLASAAANEKTRERAEGEVREEHQRNISMLVERDAALRSNQAKSEFIAHMSHEIRTPLTAIKGLSEAALRSELAPRQYDYLTKIVAASQSLSQIVNDILDFSKIEAGRLDLELQAFELRNVLSNLSSVVGATEASGELELLISADKEIPATLRGDPHRLQQVLVNLTSNAVKFTQDGEVAVKVTLISRADQRARLGFVVRDTGIGIAVGDAEKVFEPFTQVEGSDSRRFGGTGLGLTISQNLVHLMGGTIELGSSVGQGSRFSFELDFEVIDERDEAVQRVPEGLKNLRVLVVDDNSSSQQILLDLLERFDFDATAVGSGDEAVAALVESSAGAAYGLVLIDYRMPGLDGIATARRIDSEPRLAKCPPKVIMVTAFGSDEIRERAFASGFAGYLTKPVQPSPLFDTIMDVLDAGGGRMSGRELPLADRILEKAPLAGARVLVVEDQPLNQLVAEEILTYAGISVTVASSGEQALERLAESEFHAVLMDVQMPGMDGYETTRAIRSDPRWRSLPVVAMTAHAMGRDRDRCLEAGMNDHVAKPIDAGILYRTLGRYVRVKPIPKLGRSSDASLVAEPLSSLPGLDAQAAVQRVLGNVSSYRRLLRWFRADHRDTAADLARMLRAGDLESASHLAHTLKGVAANVSATALAEHVAGLERALRAGAPTDDDLAAVTREMERVVAGLDDSSWLDEGDGP